MSAVVMELIPNLPNDLALECLTRFPYDSFSTASLVCRDWKFHFQSPAFWAHRKLAGFSRRLIVMAQARVDPTRKSPLKICSSPMSAYRFTVCEPYSGKWTELPPVPGYSDGLPMFCLIAAVGLDFVVMGGLDPVTWDASNHVFLYNFVSATWRRGAQMPGCPRSFFACASDPRSATVFIAGGHDCEKNALKSAMAYDVAADRWTPLPDMQYERDECKGIFHRGKFHVIGGYRTEAQGRFDRSAEAFDVGAWRWDPVCEDFMETATCPRAYVDNGVDRVYKCSSSSNSLVTMTMDSTTWQGVGELPVEVATSTHMIAWQEKVMVVGSRRFGEPHSAYVLDLKDRAWVKVGAPEEYRGHVQSSCILEM